MKIFSKVNYNVIIEPGTPKFEKRTSMGNLWSRENVVKSKIKLGEGNYNFDLTNRLVYDQLLALSQARQIVCDPKLEDYENYVRGREEKSVRLAKHGDRDKGRGKVSKKLSPKGGGGTPETTETDG